MYKKPCLIPHSVSFIDWSYSVCLFSLPHLVSRALRWTEFCYFRGVARDIDMIPFAYRNLYAKYNENEKHSPEIP